MNEMVPQRTLTKQGVAAVGGIASGVGLLVLGGLWWPISLVAGSVVALVGLSAVSSHEPADKSIGGLMTAAGVLIILAKLSRFPILSIFSGFAGSLLGLGALGLIGMGIWNGVKFVKGLKSRS